VTTTNEPTRTEVQPAALLDDKRRPPKLIWLSLFAYLGIWVIDAAVRLPKAFDTKEGVFLGDIAGPYFFLMVTVFPVMLFIFRRRNWARMVYVIMACIAFSNVRSEWKEQTATYGVAALSGQFALYLLSVVLLFVGKSREWFRVDVKKCPFCGREIRNEAVKCRYCHSWLDSDPTRSGELEEGGTSLSPSGPASDEPGMVTNGRRERKTDRTIFLLWGLGAVLFFLCFLPADTSTGKVGDHKLEVIETHLLGGGWSQSSWYGTPDGMPAFTHEGRTLHVKLEHEILTVNDKRYVIPKEDDSLRIKNRRVWINGRRAKPEPDSMAGGAEAKPTRQPDPNQKE
jgi:hypothetical protein